jgi:hypothetical protein
MRVILFGRLFLICLGIILHIFIDNLGAAIFIIMKRKLIGISFVTIKITVPVPIVSLLSSIDRGKGMSEFEHLVSQLQQSAIWSILVVIGYLFLLVW